MSILFRSLPNGWPDALVRDNHDGPTPSGHVAFDTWEAVWAWKDANDDKRPQPPAAPDPVPAEVPAWKVVLVLKTRGHYDALDAFIRTMTGPKAAAIQARWDYGDAFPRGGQAVDQLFNAALGYMASQTDDLFREADAIPG